VVEWDGLENRCSPSGYRGFESHPLRREYNFQSNFAGSNVWRTTIVKVPKVCARDRSVTAGRSHFLSASLSLYVLLDPCQGIVGHWGESFDFHSHLSFIFKNATNILIRLLILKPEASLIINSQVIQELE
jgi:hypothetical protein